MAHTLKIFPYVNLVLSFPSDNEPKYIFVGYDCFSEMRDKKYIEPRYSRFDLKKLAGTAILESLKDCVENGQNLPEELRV